jgi:hypothetical protein
VQSLPAKFGVVGPTPSLCACRSKAGRSCFAGGEPQVQPRTLARIRPRASIPNAIALTGCSYRPRQQGRRPSHLCSCPLHTPQSKIQRSEQGYTWRGSVPCSWNGVCVVRRQCDDECQTDQQQRGAPRHVVKCGALNKGVGKRLARSALCRGKKT